MHLNGICVFFFSYAHQRLVQSYDHGQTVNPLQNITIGQSVLKTVEKHPDREALVFCEDGVRYNFSDFWSRVKLIYNHKFGKWKSYLRFLL